VNFESHSQAGQDQWVFDTLVKGEGLTDGTFLDVGCGEPVHLSNTYGLEKIGWRGVLVDNEFHCVEQCRARRFSVVVLADAATVGWKTHPAMVESGFRFDYLSLDVDAWTLAALKQLLRAGIAWRMATIEHDAYRLGNRPREEIRAAMTIAGYTLHRKDVCCPGHPDKPFEDWWLDAALAFDYARLSGDALATHAAD